MTSSRALRLIAAYVAITVLVYLVVLMPGDSWSTSGRPDVFWLAVQAFVVWRLWHGSWGAWFFSLLITLLFIVSLILMGIELELASILIVSAAVAQLLILVSLRAHVTAPRARTVPS